MIPAYLADGRLADLLVQQATEGLSASETLELRGLLAQHGRPDPEVIERTAAAVLLAGRIDAEPMPAALRTRLDLAAEAFITSEFGSLDSHAANAGSLRERQPGAGRRAAERRPWLIAAACLALVVVAWWPRLESPDSSVGPGAGSASSVRTVAERRQELLAINDTLVRDWQTTDDPAATSVVGDVVWHTGRQAGYMRFRGLPANDVSQSQYQLWIFDSARNEAHPVDGGVFDIPAGADEVIVPIEAKLPVSDPTLFAVTVEKPGGVVVSSRERIVVVAPVVAG